MASSRTRRATSPPKNDLFAFRSLTNVTVRLNAPTVSDGADI